MKKIIIFILPVLLLAGGLKDIFLNINNNLLIKSKDKQIEALEKMVQVKKSNNYPSLSLSLSAIKLKDTPTATFEFNPLPPITAPVGTRDNVDFDLSFSYPLFSGFAISNSIEKAKLKVIKSKLERDDLKRKLYLKSLTLYGDIYAINQTIIAVKDALEAVGDSYKKAKGLYKNNLINLSNLYNIEAKQHEFQSKLDNLIAQKRKLSNMLFYISGVKIDKKISIKQKKFLKFRYKNLINLAIKNRKDILIIKKQLNITDIDIKLVKSGYYPQIALIGAIKKQGNNFKLNGNGYTNADNSYIGIGITWKIFDGFKKQKQEEALLAKKEATILYLQNYEKLIKINMKNSFLTLDALKNQLIAAQKQLKAQKEYLKLVQGRFDNELVSADALSRAIAKEAEVKAEVETIKAKIFIQKNKIALQVGLNYFSKWFY